MQMIKDLEPIFLLVLIPIASISIMQHYELIGINKKQGATVLLPVNTLSHVLR